MKRIVSMLLAGTMAAGVVSVSAENNENAAFSENIPYEISDVSTADVELNDEFLINAEGKDIDYLLSLEPERFLCNWYRTCGLEVSAEDYKNTWEQTSGKSFRGHMFGHYMSALSQAYKAEKDEGLKIQLLDKIKECVSGIIKCQNAYAERFPDRAGFAAPFGEYRLNQLDNVDTGDEEWNTPEEGNPSIYVPWYNLHKVVAGLIDVYKNVRDDEIGENALQCVCDFTDYVYKCRVSKYSEEQKKKMLSTEYGGMAEALYELHNITGKGEYKICADGFIENDLFEKLAAGKDVLSGLHANTTIPKLIGVLKKYTVLTQNEDYYNLLTDDEKADLETCYNAAVNFFDIVVAGHSFVTGGNSVSEHFRTANTISAFYQNPETHETCNEYNMLKLARELFKLTKDKKYADYYENTFINAILASQNPETGDMTYFQPMGAGYSKVFNKTRFWCCTGTGTENFTKLGDSIYFKDDNSIFVNMYFSSDMKDEEKNIEIKTEANLPNDDKVKISVKSVNGDAVKEGINLLLRIPDWCSGSPTVSYNGNETEYKSEGGYILMENVSDGDEIEMNLPMKAEVSELKDNPNIAAFRYGPVVLAAKLGNNNVGQSAATGVLVLKAVQDTSLPTSILLDTADSEEWKANINEHLVRIDDTDDGFIQFKMNGTYLDDSITFVPYYSIYNYRYGVYMNIAAEDSDEMQNKIYSDKQKLREEESASASLMTIDDNNYEATYNIQKSEDSKVGTYNGKNYRDAQKDGWFSYEMPIEPNTVNYLNTVYTKADKGRKFDILINDESFVSEEIVSDAAADKNGFYTKTREIPSEYTSGENIRYCEINGEEKPCVKITFRSSGGLVGGVYGLSISQEYDTNAELAGLSFNTGILSQEFEPSVKEYMLTVPENTDYVELKADTVKKSCLVYDGDILFDDTQPRKVRLTGDITDVELNTYAQDHITKTKYIITIEKDKAGPLNKQTNVTFDEAKYSGFRLLQKNTESSDTADTKTIGAFTYNGGYRNGTTDGCTGFQTVKDGDNTYMNICAGRYSTNDRNAFILINSKDENRIGYKLCFDIYFDKISGTKDTSVKLSCGDDIIAEISAAENGLKDNEWYSVDLVYDGQKWTEKISQNNETIYEKELSSGSDKISRIDFYRPDGSSSNAANKGYVRIDNMSLEETYKANYEYGLKAVFDGNILRSECICPNNQGIKLYAGVYSNGRLVEVKSSEGSGKAQLDFDTSEYPNTEYKVFAWNTEDEPLYEAVPIIK